VSRLIGIPVTTCDGWNPVSRYFQNHHDPESLCVAAPGLIPARRQPAIDPPDFSVTLFEVKTDLKRSAGCRWIAILLAGAFVQVICGCATKTDTAHNPVLRPTPYVASAEEVMQRDSVKARARQLIDSGKYKDAADARRAAEKEYPPVMNSDQGAQEAAYYRWQQAAKVQEIFEADLDKMKRRS
jgi:hypothetical protein